MPSPRLMADTPPPLKPTDGRTARRERGRATVIEVVVDLMVEGHSPPPVALVTQRAGVSEATLYRYFDTLGELQVEATTTYLHRRAHLFEVPNPGGGSLTARIDRLVKARVTLWESVAPTARLGRSRAFEEPALAVVLHDLRTNLADQIRRHFAPELALLPAATGDDIVALTATLTAFESWDHQQGDLDRSPVQIRRAWRRALTALWAT